MGKAHPLRCFPKGNNFPHAVGFNEILFSEYNAQLWFEVCTLELERWNFS